MFQVREATGKPSRYFPHPDYDFKAGSPVSIDDNGLVVPCLSNSPIGIIGGDCDSGMYSISPENFVYVWTCRILFDTDNIEDGAYFSGDLLYIKDGKFTRIIQGPELLAVGRVVVANEAKYPCITALVF